MPPNFSPPHIRNNGNKHVQVIEILDFMQILCHRKDRKVGKEIKMLGRGWEEYYVELGNIHPCKLYIKINMKLILEYLDLCTTDVECFTSLQGFGKGI